MILYFFFYLKGAEQACSKVKDLIDFQSSHAIKIGPDKPLQNIRFLTLEVNTSLKLL